MPYLVLADLIVLVHAFFVLFVLLGGVAVLRWRCLAWLHLPAAIWGEKTGCFTNADRTVHVSRKAVNP